MDIKKIVLSLIIASLITISMFVVMPNIFTDVFNEDRFYNFFNKQPDPNPQKIFILGSSQAAKLNSTLIFEKILEYDPNYIFYNLAIPNGTIETTSHYIQEFIKQKPKIVFIGIGYHDFKSQNILNEGRNPAPLFKIDYKDTIKWLDPNNNLKLHRMINPEGFTMRVVNQEIKKITENQDISDTTYRHNELLEIQPFFPTSSYERIATHDELMRYGKFYDFDNFYIQPNETNDRVKEFQYVIKELQKNNIVPVVFLNPYPREFLEMIPEQTKNEFNLIIQKNVDEMNIQMYNFTYKYQDLPIWSDGIHMAFNPVTDIYNEDVAIMIIFEMK
jgi:hypothetical protein